MSAPDPAGGEWRMKYERAMREVDFTKKRLQQEFEDKLEVEQQNKRQLERRVRLAEGGRPVPGRATRSRRAPRVHLLASRCWGHPRANNC